jgi:hypothetical protein
LKKILTSAGDEPSQVLCEFFQVNSLIQLRIFLYNLKNVEKLNTFCTNQNCKDLYTYSMNNSICKIFQQYLNSIIFTDRLFIPKIGKELQSTRQLSLHKFAPDLKNVEKLNTFCTNQNCRTYVLSLKKISFCSIIYISNATIIC